MLPNLLQCLLLFVCKVTIVGSYLRIVDKGILPLERNSVAIQFYIDIENLDKLDACILRSKPKICCLSDQKRSECDPIEVYGYYFSVIKPKSRDTALFIYPATIQHDLIGYCEFYVEHRCGRKLRKTRVIRVPFDTRVTRKSHVLISYIGGKKLSQCETLDQDSLDQCYPVNCAMKYSDQKPFYDTEVDRCTRAAVCVSKVYLQLPSLVYSPVSNTCRDLDNPLSLRDIYTINAGLSIVTDIPYKKARMTLYSNCSTISQNLMLLRDLVLKRLVPTKYEFDDYSCGKKAVLFIVYVLGTTCMTLFILLMLIKFMELGLNRSVEDLKQDFRRIKRCLHRTCRHASSDSEESGRVLSPVNSQIPAQLMKEVIISNLPLELQPEASFIFDQVTNKMRKNRRAVGDSRDPISTTCGTSITSDTKSPK